MLLQVRNLVLLHTECVYVLISLRGLPQREVLHVPGTPAQIHCLLLLRIMCVRLLILCLYLVRHRGNKAE